MPSMGYELFLSCSNLLVFLLQSLHLCKSCCSYGKSRKDRGSQSRAVVNVRYGLNPGGRMEVEARRL